MGGSTVAASPWEDSLNLIFFVYGLAFYSMGLALLVESGRASELGFARSMRLLAGFGLLHGIHEWIDLVERLLTPSHPQPLHIWLLYVRVAFLVTSFLALLAFGEHLLAREGNPRKWLWRLTVGAAVWYAFSCIIVRINYQLDDALWMQACDVLARYVLGIPGAMLACWALWRQRRIFQERGMGRFVQNLTVASFALALYGIIGQFFPRSSPIFPSMFINSDLFLQITGFPIQVFRALMAALVAVSMISVLRALEVESQQRLISAQQARAAAEQVSREELARLNAELQSVYMETERLLHEVQQRDALRGELIQRITAAQEAERKRIARELHDGTGQTLTGLALGLRGMASQVAQNPELVAQKLGILESIATNSLGELRHLINDLRPPQLDDMGLAAALRWLLDRFGGQEKPALSLEIRGEPYPLPPEVETTLFRIAQEGLTNAIKHARADHIWVTLDYLHGPSLIVHDDGVGFVPAEELNPNTAHIAWGLRGMQERASLINAILTLESGVGTGTSFSVRLTPASLQEVSDDQGTGN